MHDPVLKSIEEQLRPGQDPVLEALNRAAADVTPQDLDLQIAYLRKQRGQWESGEKPKKGEGPDLKELLKASVPSVVKYTGTMRRL